MRAVLAKIENSKSQYVEINEYKSKQDWLCNLETLNKRKAWTTFFSLLFSFFDDDDLCDQILWGESAKNISHRPAIDINLFLRLKQ